VIPVASGPDGAVDLAAGLRALALEGVVSVLCEGGGGLHGRLRDAGLVDRVVCYVAPMLMGGGLRAIGGEGARGLADVTRLHDWTVRAVGPDLRIEAEVR
jgi:diaminohydroxyphosphoribosylaminopyrimidine deaminase/5-amino-6-(5-phosphoribosylamino)uracil reductase